jgi:hypothetical protein
MGVINLSFNNAVRYNLYLKNTTDAFDFNIKSAAKWHNLKCAGHVVNL